MSDMADVKRLIEDQGRTWDDYKKTNDERLEKLEKGQSTADLDAKLAKMDGRFTDITTEVKQAILKMQRLDMGDADPAANANELKHFNGALMSHSSRLSRPAPVALDTEGYGAYKSGLRTFLRKGLDGVSDVERKALNAGTDPEGGFLVDSEMDAAIDRVATKSSAIRSLARVVTIGSASFKKMVKTSGAAAGGWGGETTAPSETGAPGWTELEFTPGTVWAEPRATSQVLEDAVFDLEGDLTDEIGITFADQESQAFIDGSGVNRPRGFLAYPIVANASYAWGSLGYVASGGAADFAASNPSDRLVDLQHALKRTYRAGANWVMNDATLGKIRKFKDGQGIYLWAPSGLLNGIAGQLLGYSVVTDDYMPDVGADAYAVAFGDFRRGYVVVDRRGTTILRDPYTAKPYVKFYATRRVGGGMQNFEAIKLLKIANS